MTFRNNLRQLGKLNMHRIICLMVALALGAGGIPTASAQTLKNEATTLPWAAVDTNTALLARAKLTALNVESIVSKLAVQLPEEKKQLLGIQVMMASGLLKQMTQAGVDEVYVLASTRQLNTDHVLIVPCRDEKIVGEVLQMLVNEIPKEFGYKVYREPRLIAVCGEGVWTRIKERQERLRTDGTGDKKNAITAEADLAVKHWRSITDPLTSSHWAVVSLPEPLRKELSLLWPNEVQFGGATFSLSDFVKDSRSLTLSVEATDSLTVSLATNCKDAAAAERVETQINGLVRTLPDMFNEFRIPRPEVTRKESQVQVTWGDLYTAIEVTVPHALEAALDRETNSSLRQIGLAIHKYVEKAGHLPPRASVDSDGKELLSWRVHLLPFLGEQALYAKFNLAEPWDSEQNAKLIAQIPAVYRGSQEQTPEGTTRMQFPVTAGSL
jgi:hypothetical protein